jgi:hypothetical protein
MRYVWNDITRQAFHAWERKVRKHQVNCTRCNICTEIQTIQTTCTSVIPKKGTWTSASFSKCRSALIRHKLVFFFPIWILAYANFLCRKKSEREKKNREKKAQCVWKVLRVKRKNESKKNKFFDGLNRLENPARTCTSSNLPCGHVIRDNITFASPRKCKYFFYYCSAFFFFSLRKKKKNAMRKKKKN